MRTSLKGSVGVSALARSPALRVRFAVPLLVVVGWCLVGCSHSTTTPPVAPTGGAMSPLARSYLEEMVRTMAAHSINRHQIDWAAFRSSVFDWAGSAQTINDVTESGAIPQALRLLQDHHSMFVKADGTYIYNPLPRACGDAPPPAVAVPTGIGYVKLRPYDGGGNDAEVAASIQDRIRSEDRNDPAGWLIDLRGNTGGDMWPTLAGVGPVLGEGLAGAFIDSDGYVARWGYAHGASWMSGNAGDEMNRTLVPAPYGPLLGRAKVAVLTDCTVASAGEAIVVAFRGRPNTRSFGTHTYGNSTGNSNFRLSDGALLLLTVSTMADRNLTRYGDVIQPDEVLANPGEAVARAIAWLRTP